MSNTIHLTGMTWDHTRGYVPMVATSQRFSELHPEVEITWHKRSLKAFGDQPIEEFAAQYDFLVIDHPFVGFAAAHHILLPLDDYLSADYLAEQAAGSVGASHPSYSYGGHHWALAIDAATPVASWRADLLERAGSQPPSTWEELLALARRGLVAVPAVPIDSLMNFYMLCLALGEDPFGDPERFAPSSGAEALHMLRELVLLCGPACFQRNPIGIYEALVSGAAAYCPCAYGYSNYARAGYAEHRLIYGGLVSYGGRALRSTLGGTGLAISAACKHHDAALAYARYVASPRCQQTLFVASGGQPGHRSAWEDPDANAMTGDFFLNTLPTLDDAYLRPRHNGYLHFQDQAALIVQRYLRDGGDAVMVIDELGRLFAEPHNR